MKENVKLALLAGVSVLISSTGSQAGKPAAQASGTESSPTVVQVDAASVASIEKSFIEVSGICKACNSPLDPVDAGSERVSAEVLAIHLALDSVGSVA